MRTAEADDDSPLNGSERSALIFRMLGRATWIRAAAACRPKPERAAIYAMSVFDEAIDGFPCAFPGCMKPRAGGLCRSHTRQAARRGSYRKMTKVRAPSGSPEGREAARVARAAKRAAKPPRVPAAARLHEPCRRCGSVDWAVHAVRGHSDARKCRVCARRRRSGGNKSEVTK